MKMKVEGCIIYYRDLFFIIDHMMVDLSRRCKKLSLFEVS